MKTFKFIAVIMLGVLMSSCATSRHKTAYTTMVPDEVRLNLDMHDMVCLGEVEVSITEDVYFGFIKSTRTVNGEKYNSWKKTSTSLAGATWGHTAKSMNKATYKVLEKFPNAEYFRVVRESSVTKRMFGMKEVTRTATIKAYTWKAGNHGITTCGGCCKK